MLPGSCVLTPLVFLGVLLFFGGCASFSAQPSEPVSSPSGAQAPEPVRQPISQTAAEALSVHIEPRTGMELVLVRGGCFHMGEPLPEGTGSESPSGMVCVDDFYIGRTEVTQGQWMKVIKRNPSAFARGDDYPVEAVSWQDAQAFIAALNGGQGRYRLPTEAEWEYAARSGGRQERISGGVNEDELAWYEDNSDGATHPVARMKANGLGLYDMSGNVSEWCGDWYSVPGPHQGSVDNPKGPAAGDERVIRGDNWDGKSSKLSSAANRNAGHPSGYVSDTTGFRVALPLGR